MIWLVIFFALLLGIGIFDYFRIQTFDQFVVAGRNQKESLVMMSLLATTIGASATLGAANLAYNIGFPAFWWLGAGALGLIFQALFLSRKVRAFKGYTLPHIAKIVVGEEGKLIIALVIALSWIGIIAAQLVALSDIISIVTGNPNSTALLVIASSVIILYTVIGGQLSIIKTDALQFILLAGGLIFAFYFLFIASPHGNPLSFSNIQLMNPKFDIFNLLYFLLIVGGSYFIGPDVFSRNFTAKDGRVARNATFKAGILLAVAGVLITLIGLWAKELPVDIGKTNVLIFIIGHYLPKTVAVMLSLGLLAAIISSADTCIITTAAILENDIFKRGNLVDTRLLSLIIGLIALAIAIFKKNIIALLLSAYSIFTPGVVCPLFIAIWFHKKRDLNKFIWISALVSGGTLGLLSNVFNLKYLALIGMGVSLILAIASLSRKKTAPQKPV